MLAQEDTNKGDIVGSIASTYTICRETNYLQFNEQDKNFTPSSGEPNWGPPHGFGIMQLDPPNACSDIWNWQQNVTDGYTLLQQKETTAKNHLSDANGLTPFCTTYTQAQLITETTSLNNGGYYYNCAPTGAIGPNGNPLWGWVPKPNDCDMCYGQTPTTHGYPNSGHDLDSNSKTYGECIKTGVCYVRNYAVYGCPELPAQ